MPLALLLSPCGFNSMRCAKQKPGGRSSIEDSQEAGKWGAEYLGHQRLPRLGKAWRGGTGSDPGGAGRGMSQCADASRCAMATASEECACAWRCDLEVHPQAHLQLCWCSGRSQRRVRSCPALAQALRSHPRRWWPTLRRHSECPPRFRPGSDEAAV